MLTRLLVNSFYVGLAGLTAFVVGGTTNAKAITIVYPSSSNYLHQAFDPAGSPPPDSYVILNPDPVKYTNTFFRLSSVSQALKDELAGGDTAFPGWSFDYSYNSLAGIMTINKYKAGYTAAHYGGAEIDLTYQKGSGDPNLLRYIQLVTTNDPVSGATSPYIDPFPNDGTDGAPFYYYEGEVADPLHFYDYPKRSHPLPVPFNPILWRAELYLVEWDGAKTVKFRDGIQWGWEMHPVPGPLAIMGVPAFFAYSRKLRRLCRLNTAQKTSSN